MRALGLRRTKPDRATLMGGTTLHSVGDLLRMAHRKLFPMGVAAEPEKPKIRLRSLMAGYQAFA